MPKRLLQYLIIASTLTIFFFSCKKFVTLDAPTTQLVSESVYNSDATATAVMTGLYSNMIKNGIASGDNMSVTLLTGLSSDELLNYSGAGFQAQFYESSLTASNPAVQSLWTLAYKFLYSSNAVIEGLSGSGSVSVPVENQVMGEAKFIRSFLNFYLVNLFGNVPLILTTDYAANATVKMTDPKLVYQQIILDLKDAQLLLSKDYSFSGGERTRPNYYTATAFLARVYLFTGDWQNAELQATEIINNTDVYQLEPNLDDVFLASSKEAIWQLVPNTPGLNTNEGYNFILTSPPTSISLNPALENSFEPEDRRNVQWVQSLIKGTDTFYYPFKYKIKGGTDLSEYSMVLRLAEQYLIRSEARSHLSNVSGALEDLNAVRNRAGLANISANDASSIIAAIQHERQVELFCEWGHRWTDLKRYGLAGTVLEPLKGSKWQETDTLYPIPTVQLQNDPFMNQNPGY